MSASESKFIKWFGGIASALIIASIIGTITIGYIYFTHRSYKRAEEEHDILEPEEQSKA